MNLRDCAKHIRYNILAGNATLLEGPPGFGKTDLMTKLAVWFRGQHQGKRVGFSCFFMATQTPIGFTGLPWRGSATWKDPAGVDHVFTTTDPAVPQWYMATCLDTGERLPASCFDKVFLVIEEWGQGSAETKRAGAEVLRAGGTPPYYLPPGSARVALTNVDASDGVTKEFDFLFGRRGKIVASGDTDVWLEDFADKPYVWQGKTWNVLPFTKNFARSHPDILFEPKPKKQGPWCNPRSLTNGDRYVQCAAEDNNGEIPGQDPAFMDALAGHIGHPAMVQYCGDLQFLLELPHYEDVVKDPDGTALPARADLMMLMVYELAGRVKPDDLAPVLQYVSRLTKKAGDMPIAFVASLLRRDYKNTISHPAMQAWIQKNAAAVSIIASLN